ncbi:MAG: class I SAM-dependent methyltransferase [Micromonosporaceae bacterium]
MNEAVRETRDTYDAIAAEFARRTATAYPDVLGDVDWLARSVPGGAWVVDAGCGPGRDTALLRTRGLRVVGVDLSAAQLRSGGLPNVVQADMRHLPVGDAAVHGIWCQAALLHIPHQHVPAVLNEFGRILKVRGQLHLTVAEGDGEDWEVAANYGSRRRRWFAYHREPDLTTHLASAGFVVDFSRRARHGRDWLTLRAHLT